MSGSSFIDAHTHCNNCGDPVRPGEYHQCKFGENFTPSTTKFLCTWCKNWAQAVPGKGTTKCSVCEKGLHAAIANNSHTVIHRCHFPFVTTSSNIPRYMPSNTPYNIYSQFQTSGNIFGTRW
ncbi:hypothetical protein QKC54_gp0034 [Megavirus baoshan]|uniref:C2H2-type domain-containing protein n=1 Tax=Megavirus baoshan TaxID=2496520 RepID=A0A3S8UYG8_9VIRU|nr:hypothetical protein QKC54_gp0034 [Megavirus baoshan]AZL89865.1 hypothetical protein Mb1038 [Megavirus baoshan]